MTPHPGLPPAIHVLRAGTAATFIIHGVARAWAGGLTPFGGFFESLGLPAGVVFAWGVTVIEIVGGAVLAAGRVVVPLSTWFILQLAAGIALVHAQNGWFVVGLGRNGVEFSLLLILCLGCVAWMHREQHRSADGQD